MSAAATVTKGVGSAPTPVICVTGHLYDDQQIAHDASMGRFHHLGVTLALGRRPDWLAVPVRDVEWRIEWIKLYEGLHLASAFAKTGDRDFLETWQDLVESYVEQVPVGYEPSDVSARRIQNWLYAWQSFAASEFFGGLREDLPKQLRERVIADADHLSDHLTGERNHRTLELYTLLLVGIAFGDKERAATALADLADNAVTDIWVDGVHRECSTDYHMLVLRSMVGAIANARRAGLAVPAAILDRANRACDVALHLCRPDGVTPAISDGDEENYNELIDLAAKLLDRSDLAWSASGGTSGSPPRKRLVGFPVGGYYVQRSGWGDRDRAYANERWAVFDCGPIGDGGHGHYDQLSLVVAADGLPLLVDPGRFTYDPESQWRQWFKGTAAHNTVCVDGLDQTPYRPGKPQAPVSVARLLGRASVDGLDVLRGEVRSPSYDAVHTRTVAFVADEYWIIHDRLRAPSAHTYEARWHLAPHAENSTTLDVDDHQTTVTAPGGTLVVPTSCGRVSVESGWVSPTYGTKVRAPIVAVATDGRTADFMTVVRPGREAPSVDWAVERDRLTVRVAQGSVTDTVTWSVDEVAARWERSPC